MNCFTEYNTDSMDLKTVYYYNETRESFLDDLIKCYYLFKPINRTYKNHNDHK